MIEYHKKWLTLQPEYTPPHELGRRMRRPRGGQQVNTLNKYEAFTRETVALRCAPTCKGSGHLPLFQTNFK